VTVFPYLVACFVFLVGLAGVVTSRNLVHLVVSLGVAQSGTYVLLLAIGYRDGGTAPVFGDVRQSRKAVDPIVQALTLTDVVVGVTVSALLLALALQVRKREQTLDPDALHTVRG
jgi:multicomponent Na+:H+ antiporter subunit C